MCSLEATVNQVEFGVGKQVFNLCVKKIHSFGNTAGGLPVRSNGKAAAGMLIPSFSTDMSTTFVDINCSAMFFTSHKIDVHALKIVNNRKHVCVPAIIAIISITQAQRIRYELLIP